MQIVCTVVNFPKAVNAGSLPPPRCRPSVRVRWGVQTDREQDFISQMEIRLRLVGGQSLTLPPPVHSKKSEILTVVLTLSTADDDKGKKMVRLS